MGLRLHLHVVSDSTGETVTTVSRAALSQFEDVMAVEHVWSFVRSEQQLDTILQEIEALPGAVLFTMVSAELRARLQHGCERIGVPCVPVLDPVMHVLQGALGLTLRPQVGGQHALDAGYFARIEAMNFMLRHDDGMFTDELEQADLVLVGVSRTSKTPTCLYLANRGVKAANVPIVPEQALPGGVDRLRNPLVVGLTINPEVLSQIRVNRLRQIGVAGGDARFTPDYAEVERIKAELVTARRLFAKQGWPVIDVTRRSVEETAAGLMQLLRARLAQAPDVGL
ncbi:pyruvate, water dikinase regulatory protein [Marinivivus vitaminiproducens]|uniref:pyruvate, water dikinase regulatory protein n=1 Tax=Marinivivus vitaminiproducens TaxID=3035935 RepID=UPI00279B13D7|nr:kinase/pyrophosphorylase [Geminicoccaceae bacterium SCSIO 64248]